MFAQRRNPDGTLTGHRGRFGNFVLSVFSGSRMRPIWDINGHSATVTTGPRLRKQSEARAVRRGTLRKRTGQPGARYPTDKLMPTPRYRRQHSGQSRFDRIDANSSQNAASRRRLRFRSPASSYRLLAGATDHKPAAPVWLDGFDLARHCTNCTPTTR
jgi:hypothetical protein